MLKAVGTTDILRGKCTVGAHAMAHVSMIERGERRERSGHRGRTAERDPTWVVVYGTMARAGCSRTEASDTKFGLTAVNMYM